MKQVYPLLNQDILIRQLYLCSFAARIDLISYNATGAMAAEIIGRCKNTRLIIGAPEIKGERQAVITSKAQNWATQFPQVQVRVLLGSHIKLLIAHTYTKPIAIIGSQNLGFGHPFELGVEIQGPAVHKLINIYNMLWGQAQPVKPLDMKKIVDQLRSSTFEAPREA